MRRVKMWEKELKAMQEAALLAQKEILHIYHTHFNVEIKSDSSPVTAADKNADKMIREYLGKLFPTYAFLTEESKDTKERLENDFVFIVDPVDGTKEFVAHNGEFTTNIALAYKHRVVAGVINVPMQDTIYYASEGNGAYSLKKGESPKKLQVSTQIGPKYVCLLSRSFAVTKEKELLEKHKEEISSIEVLGAALKFVAIAKGDAHMFYRFSNGTKEWDVASGDIIVREAGGIMLKPNGLPYSYNREDVYNREGYILLNRLENKLN